MGSTWRTVLSTEKKAPGTFFDVSNPQMVRCGHLLFFIGECGGCCGAVESVPSPSASKEERGGGGESLHSRLSNKAETRNSFGRSARKWSRCLVAGGTSPWKYRVCGSGNASVHNGLVGGARP